MPSGRPHSVYIDDDLWDAAMARAESDRTSVARIINSGLRSYLGIDVPAEADDDPFGGAEATEGAAPQQESAIASDVATAQITRRVTSTKPADDFEKARRPGEYSAEEMADIDAERLKRMNPKRK